MKRLRKTLSVLVLAAVGGAGVMFGSGLVKDAQFAIAQEQVQTSRNQLAKAEDLASVFRNVGKAVEPSVVNIQVHKTLKGIHRSLPFDDDTLKRFFPDRNGDGEPDMPEGFGDRGDMEQIGTGSGVIMEVNGSDAFVLTNNHVAGGADEMTVTLSDGRTIKDAKTVGADPKSDLAVVKIHADRLIPAKWGDSSKLQKGDWVMAFGSPFGYIGSMTHGIVSALNRDVGILRSSMGYENFIQVDAPINPGNSGGPLVDVQGNVIGINTAIASRSGGFQGIGFAIPSNQAKYVYEQLKTGGKVVRGWLGVAIASVSDPRVLKTAESFGYDKTDGVLVQEVMDNTPATGKLQEGDIVTAMNGNPVKDVQELRNKIANVHPGTEITLTVFREKKSQDVKLKVGEQPENMSMASARSGNNANGDDAAPAKGTLGLALSDLSDETRERFGVDSKVKGALVREVDPKGPAAKEGIRPGDVITKVGGQAVNSAKEARDAISKADSSKGVRLYVVGKDASRFVFVQAESK
jgi:serine protease Do